MADLKSCPFCGGEGVPASKPHSSTDTAYFIRCTSCACEGPWFRTPGNATRFWNMRVSVPSIQAPRTAPTTPKPENVQPEWLYQITYGLADSRKIRVLIDGKRFAVVQSPGGRWGDNSGTHYGSTTYYLVDKECTAYRKSVGLMDTKQLQQGGRAKLALWKHLVAQRDSNGH